MLRKTLLGATVFAFATAGLGMNLAHAAPNGQVEQGNGRSICRFSGLNDDPNQAFPEGGQVQSFGQLVKKVGVQGVRGFIAEEEFEINGIGVPGLECNPNTGPDLHAPPA